MKAYNENIKINTPISNNFFSYEKRNRKNIYVPELKEGNVVDIEESKNPAFIEFDDQDVEVVCKGLKYFIKQVNRPIYIFDNHNHSFYFAYNLFMNTKKKYDFIHIDQHKDLRDPELDFFEYKQQIKSIDDLKLEFEKLNLDSKQYENYSKTQIVADIDDIKSFLYTNIVLNVGNFIKPLMKAGVIEDFYCIDSKYKMEEFKDYSYNREYILDLDLDFFSNEMDYIDEVEKIALIRRLIKDASLVLIATSPYFIEFQKCKRIMAKIFE